MDLSDYFNVLSKLLQHMQDKLSLQLSSLKADPVWCTQFTQIYSELSALEESNQLKLTENCRQLAQVVCSKRPPAVETPTIVKPTNSKQNRCLNIRGKSESRYYKKIMAKILREDNGLPLLRKRIRRKKPLNSAEFWLIDDNLELIN